MEDQIEALQRSADITGGGQVNLANLTDGLRAEREQGITIDVAYRYFATPRRKFIVADTPGHVQYTRNMVTGGLDGQPLDRPRRCPPGRVAEQSRRHTYIAALLRIPHLVIAVNKMDLVGWSEERFQRDPRREFEAVSAAAGYQARREVHPASARWTATTWWTLRPHAVVSRGRRLLGHLETVHIASDWNLQRFPVSGSVGQPPQQSADPKLHDFRGLQRPDCRGIVRTGPEGPGPAEPG
jgi:sulfate adenylyltransferase subunit 1